MELAYLGSMSRDVHTAVLIGWDPVLRIREVYYFSFEVLKKKIWADFQRNIEFFTKKIVKKLLKIWSWDPGSEIRDPEKTCSGSRI